MQRRTGGSPRCASFTDGAVASSVESSRPLWSVTRGWLSSGTTPPRTSARRWRVCVLAGSVRLQPDSHVVRLKADTTYNQLAQGPSGKRRGRTIGAGQVHAVADRQTTRRAGGQFDHRAGAEVNGDTPRRQPGDAAYRPVAVDEHNVDREAHERRMDGKTGRDHEGRCWVERLAAEQPLAPCRTRRRDFDARRHRLARARVDELNQKTPGTRCHATREQ